MIKKPMLAATVKSSELEQLEWPMLASPKVDGIRCLNHPEFGPVTRSFKSVANKYVRDTIQRLLQETPLDGELIAIDENKVPLTFNQTQSAIMTRGGQPKFLFAAFDCFQHPDDAYQDRLADTYAHVNNIEQGPIVVVPHEIVKDPEEFIKFAQMCTQDGYEGAMLRDPEGPYKNGRSTLRQQWLIKYKEWTDAEGIVIGFDERMHNAGEDIKDNFGHAKRTSHKANMEPMGTLGAFVLATAWGQLNVGTGFDDTLRQEIWDRNMVLQGSSWIECTKEMLFMKGPFDKGRIVKFKYQSFGMQEKPRFPVFMGFREDE